MVYDVDIASVPEQSVVALRGRGAITEIGAQFSRSARSDCRNAA